MEEVERSGCNKRKAEMLEKDLDKVEQILEEVADLYDKAVPQLGPGDRERVAVERDNSYEEVDRWIRGARAKIRRSTQESPSSGPSTKRHSNLERIPLPLFLGQPEQWPDFKRQFLELTENEGLGPASLLAHLRKCLPAAARAMVAGRSEVKDVWAALDRRYGDTNLAIINTKAKLANLDTGRGEDFDKVEKLLEGVTEGQATLKALGAEEEILNNLALVSSLITKLPKSNQDYWHRYSTGATYKADRRSRGEKFAEWLKQEAEAANSAKLSHLASQANKGSVHEQSLKCGKCGKWGHKSSHCTVTQGREGQDTVSGLSFHNNGAAEAQMETSSGERNSGDKPRQAGMERSEWARKMRTREGAEEILKIQEAKAKQCPVCKGKHTYSRKLAFGEMKWPSDQLEK